jgi:soluble lytic murein transglycosylase-like protein
MMPRPTAATLLAVLLLAAPAGGQETPATPPAAVAPQIAPAPEPAKPAPEADKPADVAKPAAEAAKPAPESAKPAGEAAKPAAESAKPAAEAANPASEPANSAADATKLAPTSAAAQTSICMLLESAARAHDLPVEFFARVIWQESRFRADAVGPVTRSGQRAQGIAQFMPGTAAERSLLNPFDPIQALPKSAEFLRELRREFGNLGLAAAAYNAGPRRVRDWLAGNGSMPAETRNYVMAITGSSVEQWAKAGEGDPKRQQGPSCGELVALLKRAPNPFVASLEHRIILGAMQPWGVILGADQSRDRMMSKYAALQQRHGSVLAGRDPILLERRRGPLPRYQVRIGAQTRAAANDLCSRIHKSGGDCVVLHNPRG